MKKWIQKLLSQFETDADVQSTAQNLSEDRATLLYLVDAYSRNLLDFDSSPARKVREIFDDFAKDLIHPNPETDERTLFRFRQYFASYRIEETSHVQKTFDDFRNIVWELVDQLAEDLNTNSPEARAVHKSLEDLKDAVEANSIESLKVSARSFIDNYVEVQAKRDRRRTQRVDVIRKNLESVRRQLSEVTDDLNRDHMTKAFNRKAFDEHMKNTINLFGISKRPSVLILADIDHFKKVNDTFGHDIGDFVIKECVRTLGLVFNKSTDFLARIGGEEFAILLPDHGILDAKKRIDQALAQIRGEAFVQESHTIRFTLSAGLAIIKPGDSAETWFKRADQALYYSKTHGRNRLTIAGAPEGGENVA